jgi:hypothetical protein
MARRRSFSPLRSILTSLARGIGLEPRLLEARLRRRWPAIAGDVIAAHTRPEQIRYKKLYLIAESSVWLQHLTFMKPALIEKINEAAGGSVVTDILLRVGEIEPAAAPAAAPADRAASPAPTPEARAEALRLTAGVKDPELRARLAEAVAAALGSSPPRPDPAPRPPDQAPARRSSP